MRPKDCELRRTVQKQSLDIVSLREKISPVVKSSLGIDACSNEIGCRPEIFAQAFRFLSSKQKLSTSFPTFITTSEEELIFTK
ncbi:hypothetical protein G9F72_026300 [Clostridium estertheticum]|uniref:hypothetical protein n=1 Tax=Clostridium estertheticum TaxID=238834 RepID=UPI0013E9269F|nr:hypothetical protein [Clostridium estertheticum]MBZ9689789.1 hypothetical protein [Clostridium estertheticum]